jgi:hypothetical protein
MICGCSITMPMPPGGTLTFMQVPAVETFGNQYDPLSSGSLLYSGNARPMPKVAAYSDYMPVPYSRGYIEFKGYLFHGWYMM